MIKEQTKPVPLRLKVSEMRDLKREAKNEFMTLAGYIRKLVLTHPSRPSSDVVKLVRTIQLNKPKRN